MYVPSWVGTEMIHCKPYDLAKLQQWVNADTDYLDPKLFDQRLVISKESIEERSYCIIIHVLFANAKTPISQGHVIIIQEHMN